MDTLSFRVFSNTVYTEDVNILTKAFLLFHQRYFHNRSGIPFFFNSRFKNKIDFLFENTAKYKYMSDDSKNNRYQLKGKELVDASVLVKTWIRAVKNTLERREKIRDPMARNMMLLDQMCIGMDFIGSIADTFPKEIGFDRELCLEIKDVSDKMKHSVDSLFDWIQHPTYTTQHPVGAEMMKNGQEKLDSIRPLDQ
jgi:hypothetical protein